MKLALVLEMCILAWLSVLSEQRWMVVMACGQEQLEILRKYIYIYGIV